MLLLPRPRNINVDVTARVFVGNVDRHVGTRAITGGSFIATFTSITFYTDAATAGSIAHPCSVTSTPTLLALFDITFVIAAIPLPLVAQFSAGLSRCAHTLTGN